MRNLSIKLRFKSQDIRWGKLLNLKLRPLGNGYFSLRSDKNVKSVKRKLRNSVAGFTLIELVIVMAMIGIISSASFKLIRFSDTNRNLSVSLTELKGVIRTAQTLALAPPVIDEDSLSDSGNLRTICGFGIRNGSGISSNKIEIFYSYSASTPPDVKDCRIIDSFTSACGGNNLCVEYETKTFNGFTLTQDGDDDSVGIFFRSPYGKVFGDGIIKMLQDGQGYFKKVEINEYGKINIVP